ncbi:RND family efflux transporter, MFP subunit [Malonomonas rubra DSM 5091]|uniref:RND family efflux transporter, MFP subunit n=1 Tax=Malonomonas rubra DSM 5091 TaxID=1122189 RepID=A0A1M6NKG1_MALRU|nr:efflux RND transporter periplasmic adaptor subunit [Malonomonas rubra]SHJ96258.1 RND family efflux transporter, MFP subunit [Malonomonas rubra DSM 5091]
MPKHQCWKLFTYLLICLLIPIASFAEEQKKPQGPPPMLVEVAAVSEGTAEPMVELVGSIRYGRVSRVASEVGGIVEMLNFKEGGRVKAGQPLVKLRSDLLQTALAGTEANYEQVLVQLEKARKDLNRISALYQEKSIAESVYDDSYYGVQALEKQSAALKASLDRQQLELQKTSIPAPFSGLVQTKLVEKGEWVSTGGQVAVIADDSDLEAHIDVPQNLLGYLQAGKQLQVRAAGKTYSASFINFIPQGDVATRTFTVKLKLKNAKGLIEGMEAQAQLPNGPRLQGLLVPRDAVIKQFGMDVVFLAVEGAAKMVPVQINGYQGMKVAVAGEGLEAGAQVVVKGNERIRDGQGIRF